MTAARVLRQRVTPIFRDQHVWHQVHHYDHGLSPSKYFSSHVRHMGIFQEFSKRLRGEVEKNPELQKSIQQLKEKTSGFKQKTKETTEKIYKHVGVMREEVGVKAKQVKDVLKESVNEVKGKVTDATSQVKGSVNGMNLGKDTEQTKSSSESRGTDPSSKTEDRKEYSTKEAPSKPFFLHKLAAGFQTVSSSTYSLFSKVKHTKLVDLAKKGYDIAKVELTTTPSRRRKAKYAATSTAPRSSVMDVVPVIKKRTIWDAWKEKAEGNRIYKRFKGVKKHPVVLKGQEIAEDMRERWETSDSPLVHKIQDINESLFGETATAMALKEIRRRDPTFAFPDFLAEVQENARDVLQAYLKGDIEELQKRCSREVVDRCRAERRAYESQGIFFDNKILHVSDLELKETKLLGNVPIVIITFQTQQIFCVRDKHGKITQGAKDDIMTVFYAWAMQQVSPEEMEEDDIYPQWQLREMQQLGIQAII